MDTNQKVKASVEQLLGRIKPTPTLTPDAIYLLAASLEALERKESERHVVSSTTILVAAVEWSRDVENPPPPSITHMAGELVDDPNFARLRDEEGFNSRADAQNSSVNEISTPVLSSTVANVLSDSAEISSTRLLSGILRNAENDPTSWLGRRTREYGIDAAHLIELLDAGAVGYQDPAAPLTAGTTGRTRLVHDQPAVRDLLGRRPLAEEIVGLITRLAVGDGASQKQEAFAVHLDAPWGAGKTSLVGFVANGLRQADPPWVIVTLDAWRASQLSPAWWAVLSAMRDGVRRDKNVVQRCWFDIARFSREVRRLWRVWVPFLGVAIILWVLQLRTDNDVFGTVSDIWPVLLVIAGIAGFGTRFLSLGSMQGARIHQRLHDNPMQEVAERLWWLRVRAGKPILLILDDIDRCNEKFAVELLDAVQTLLRTPTHPPPKGRPHALVVVGVGDHRWLQAAYDHVYKVFSKDVGEPGRPLGRLFLDKLFQLHIDLPNLNADQMNGFMRSLVRPESTPRAIGQGATRDFEPVEDPRSDRGQELVDAARDAIRSPLTSAGSVDDELARFTAEAKGLGAEEAQRVLTAVLRERRADSARVERERHLLEQYANLLEPNPRAAKRFIMAYNINWTARTAEGNAVDSSKLALWTLFSTRWPALASWLRDQLPDGPIKIAEAPDHPSRLLLDPQVKALLELGSDLGGPLNAETIMQCCGLITVSGDPRH